MKGHLQLFIDILYLIKLYCFALEPISTNYQNEQNTYQKIKQHSYFNILSSKMKVPQAYKKFYHTNDIYTFMDNLYNKNSDFVDVLTIGHTQQGTPLKIIKIKPRRLKNKHILWIDGGTHAREWITISSLIYIANELIYNRQSLPQYMKKINFVLMPIVNPDGYTYTHEKDRMWRKNRVKTQYENCTGIDLNRNWDYDWNNTNSDTNYCSDTYRGPYPNSELEIKAIVQYIRKNLNEVKGFISLHSYGQSILFPWAYTYEQIKDYKELHKIATSMSLNIFKKTSKIYTVGSASTSIYQASGTSIDWIKGIANIKYVFALELRDTGLNGFNLTTNEIIPTSQEALTAVFVLAKTIEHTYGSKGAFSRCRPMHYLNILLVTFFYFIYLK